MEHHYFASNALGWATADTRDEAIEKLVNSMRREIKDMMAGARKRGDAGAYIWSCMVHAPADAEYSIEYYAPKGVRKTDGQEHMITYLSKDTIAKTRIYDQAYRDLKRTMQDPEALLKHLDSLLAEMVSDKMDEFEGEKSPGHDFVVAEDAAPELDEARTHVQEALDLLSDEETEKPDWGSIGEPT